MSKTFRPWTIDQPLLLPPSVQDFVGEDHLARFILALVLEPLDLGEIEAAYASERGQPPFDPAMMTALLLYGYCHGVYSSRRIAKAARERVDFLSIVGLDPPDFRTVSDFRKRHLKALAGLFGQVLKLCEQAGLVKLGHVALDGTKIKANASKHKAMSYERMEKRAAELEAEVERWLLAQPRLRTPRKTEPSAATRAARSCPNGSPTRRSASRRSGRRRPNWRPGLHLRLQPYLPPTARGSRHAAALPSLATQRASDGAALRTRRPIRRTAGVARSIEILVEPEDLPVLR